MNIEPARTALLVMDVQADTLGRLGAKAPPVIERIAGLVTAARRAKVPVIYVVIGFRPGYPELDPASRFYAMVAPTGRFVGTPGADIPAQLAPQDGELVVVKKRVSAFAGSDLEMLLRARGITTLIATGFATSGVVLSTVRQAADLDYHQIVVADGCADGDDEVHDVLTKKVFARSATVASTADVVTALAAIK